MNGSTNSNSRDALILKKAVPKSLTEDDLEHISRLPSQEIVLVYFPDTKRFKELTNPQVAPLRRREGGTNIFQCFPGV